jgi:hypothetical protein
MRSIVATTLFLIVCTWVLAAQAQVEQDITRMPGYVDLERIEIPRDAEEMALVDLTPSLLQLATSTTDEDPELARALAMIRSLRVKSFSLDEEHAAQLRPIIDDIQDELERDGWDQLVYVRSGDEIFTLSTKKDEDKIAGLMVVAFEPGEEAAFVNVVGEINLSTLLAMARGFDDGDLDDILDQLEDAQDEDDD